MAKALHDAERKARQIRAKIRELSAKRNEFHGAYQDVLRELAELARRSMRRRRVGDR